MAQSKSSSEQGVGRDFVHLQLHTDYSLLQSAIQIKALAARLVELGQNACAVTDLGNMYAAVTFYNQLKSKGLKAIIGCEASLTIGQRGAESGALRSGELPFYSLVLLAKDLRGYESLVRLSSRAFTEGSNSRPHIDFDLLTDHGEGLIAVCAGFKGLVQHYLSTGNEERADWAVGQLAKIFGEGDLYLGVQDHGLTEEKELNRRLRAFSTRHGIPLLATNDCHYLTEEDAQAHQVLICIGEGRTVDDPGARRFQGSQYYVKSAEEMWEALGADYPDALANTVAVADRCNVSLAGDGTLHLPNFPIPAESSNKSKEEYFEQAVMEGFERRRTLLWEPMAAAGALKYPVSTYEQRVRTEIETIIKMEFPGYFLIVWDFIRYAKERGIPVGPGRGSAAGSLVAYCLDITDIDPIQYELLFERFLNPERVSMPDIDIDFCIRGRGEVIDHVTELYGRDSVCQIITFGTMASRAAIKDVGRALNMPYGDVEKIAKLIPPPVRGRNVSISTALESVPELKKLVQTDPKVKDVVELALRLEGCSRHSSVHAAGVVISPKPLEELVPVAISSKNELTSQYSMTDLEKVGMLKMDFLGLTTLTVISDTLRSIRERTGAEIDWKGVPDGDEETMRLFADGRTDAIFQFESSGMQEITRKLRPKVLEDLAALNALYRPGPLDGGMVDDFIRRHRGETEVEYLVPEMEEILKNTFGILVYQEQIMQIAQKLGGYSLGEADLMRRAMGKKKREEMEVHEEKFISGAIGRGIEKSKAKKIFDLMAQFADYGFNRSHSVAYAYIAYQTAYLKAHFAPHFYAAVLSHEANDSAKVYKYANELRSAGLKLLPPDINESGEGFTPTEDAVRYGLTAIKGLGTNSVQAIIAARDNGPFSSLFDFTQRIPSSALNRKALESLVCAGAFDSLKPEGVHLRKWRAQLHSAIEPAIGLGQRAASDREKGQESLFGGIQQEVRDASSLLPDAPEWDSSQLLAHEKAAVGFYLSSHPLDQYQKAFEAMGIRSIADLAGAEPKDRVRIAGVLTEAAFKFSRKGNRFCVSRLEDQTGGVKLLAWAKALEKFSSMLTEDEQIVVEGLVESNDGTDISVVLDSATRLSDALPQMARRVVIGLPKGAETQEKLDSILDVVRGSSGECEVALSLELESGIVLEMGSIPVRIHGSSSIERRLTDLGCSVNWNASA